MSLDSCLTCGHALAIADHRCRHCSPGSTTTPNSIKGVPFYWLAAFAVLGLALVLYYVLVR